MSNPLLAYRKKNGLSQKEMSGLLGISRPMVALIERGARNITAELAIKIEERLGIDRVLTRPDLFRKNGKRCRFEDTCVHSPVRKS